MAAAMRALAHRLCESMAHLPSKRSAHSAALLTSGCALLLSLLLWVNVRAGCRAAAAISLAGGEGGATGDAGTTAFLEQQLREQQARNRDLEMLLADERSEKQQVRGARGQRGAAQRGAAPDVLQHWWSGRAHRSVPARCSVGRWGLYYRHSSADLSRA